MQILPGARGREIRRCGQWLRKSRLDRVESRRPHATSTEVPGFPALRMASSDTWDGRLRVEVELTAIADHSFEIESQCREYRLRNGLDLLEHVVFAVDRVP